MKLVDSSCWVHYLRSRGDTQIIARVKTLLIHGEAAWCPMVRLELWNGVGGDADRRILREFEHTLPELPITDAVWEEACELADRCRQAGKTTPATDCLIAACARHHQVELEHADSHFEFLMKL